ncbi:uncharacterized protein LOC120284072 [Dioscorea cayenensis subsp. rotundata]|uniref:Uncharacterized protein LOC120284072 n=1 Tax=Dioscorea cayennensis subsp. rotundata TaxID=55577 RepID=A0AB40D3C2_DIOCR|nr:uncharacterized protein LOC120284072 [Dioscorea cayenensis subsp. rotundata]
MKPKGGHRRDPAWKYGTKVEIDGDAKGYTHIRCNFCHEVVKRGVKGLNEHLACTHKNVTICHKVLEEVKQEMHSYLKISDIAKQVAQKRFDDMVDSGSYVGGRVSLKDVNSCPNPFETSSGGSSRGIRGPMDRFIANLEDGIEGVQGDPKSMNPTSANEAHNRSIGSYGQGLKPPTMYELRSWILEEEVKTTKAFIDEVRKTWTQIGVSILSDGRKDMRGRSLINFLANNPQGTIFLKSIDASNVVKDATMLFKLLDDVMVEDIGEELVIQVITNDAGFLTINLSA